MTEPVPPRMPSTDQELEVWTRAFIQLLPRFGLEFSLEELAELADDALDQWRIRKRSIASLQLLEGFHLRRLLNEQPWKRSDDDDRCPWVREVGGRCDTAVVRYDGARIVRGADRPDNVIVLSGAVPFPADMEPAPPGWEKR